MNIELISGTESLLNMYIISGMQKKRYDSIEGKFRDGFWQLKGTWKPKSVDSS